MSDEAFVALAIREAEKGLYTAHPNPRVGCVLVKEGNVIGRGFHRQTGTAHAEVNAVADAEASGHDVSGATAYVTLEPCSYVGRTPACANLLVEKKIARVVYAIMDPHDGNRGRGFDILRAAGIEVHGPVLEASGRALNPGHLCKYEQGRPYVRLKLAMSLDGKTALANGKSQWITGPEARADVQLLRARSGAIVTGVQTVIDDDPRLTVRPDILGPLIGDEAAKLSASIPRKICVLDSKGRLPATASLLQNPDLIQVTTSGTTLSGTTLDCEQLVLPANETGRVDLNALMAALSEMDCNEVLFECGATLAGCVLAEELVDELVVYMAPKVLGDAARSLVNLPVLSDMAEVQEFETDDIRQVGKDVRLTLKPRNRK